MTEDIYAERQKALAGKIHAGSRDSLVNFYLELAKKFGARPISVQLREEEARSTRLDLAERVLDANIIGYSGRVLAMAEDENAEMQQRLTTAMFLLERTALMRDAALKKDDAGVFAVYDSLRDSVCRLLTPDPPASPDYYRMSFREICSVYLDLEPALIAGSRLCGFMPPPDLRRIPGVYQPRLADRVEQVTMPADKKAG